MSKSLIKIIATLLIAVMAVSVMTVIVRAEDAAAGNDALDPGQFTEIDNSGAALSFQRIIGAIINIVQIIGTGVALIMLIVLAIKYISAAPGDKADIKKHAVVYVVGAIVLFAATGILQIVKNFATNVTPASGNGN